MEELAFVTPRTFSNGKGSANHRLAVIIRARLALSIALPGIPGLVRGRLTLATRIVPRTSLARILVPAVLSSATLIPFSCS